jgi:hypothetical protein
MRGGGRLAILAIGLWAASVEGTAAQEHVALRSDVLLYGDNTEFRNPFREGETIFGAAVWLFGSIELNPDVSVALGVFANQRFGSDSAFEIVRPIVSLTARGRHSTFVFGSLPARRADDPIGPDRMGPHGLLPPLQRETLTFDRPYEAGLQWTFASAPLRHRMWLSWQQLNTVEHRERFNAGVAARFKASSILALPLQIHVVHHGGQLFASGPVADSAAAAAGAEISGAHGVSVEGYGLISRWVPDRSRPAESRDGVAFFGRAAIERARWRGHVIFWRGRNFIKEEGDPNYLSIRRDGSRYRGTRDYAEAGVTRRIELAPRAALEISGRIHRVEGAYEYSYRVTSVVNVGGRIR